MTVVQTIDTVTDWIRDNVCAKIKLKQPNDEQNTTGYTVKEVHPAAFAMYQPGSDKLPPNVETPFPSVVVQLLEGAETKNDKEGTVKFQLSFTAWNPGDHQTETKKRLGEIVATDEEAFGVTLQSDPLQTKYTRHAEGWRDVWAFVDRTLLALETNEYIGDVHISKSSQITFGQFQQEGQISDLYPYWGAWVIFTIERPMQKGGQLNNYL